MKITYYNQTQYKWFKCSKKNLKFLRRIRNITYINELIINSSQVQNLNRQFFVSVHSIVYFAIIVRFHQNYMY